MDYNPQESLVTINIMGTLLGVHPIVPSYLPEQPFCHRRHGWKNDELESKLLKGTLRTLKGVYSNCPNSASKFHVHPKVHAQHILIKILNVIPTKNYINV